jgi:hypothetical protein
MPALLRPRAKKKGHNIIINMHQWYWSIHPFVLSLCDSSPNLSSGLSLLSCSLWVNCSQSQNTILNPTLGDFLKKYKLTTRNYSANHVKTLSIIEKGMTHSSIRSKVKLFLQQNSSINPLHSQYAVCQDDLIIQQKDPNSLKSYSFNDIIHLSEIKKKAGIYRIRIANTTDNYIGSATDLSLRFLQHRNKARKFSSQNPHSKEYRTIREVSFALLSV